MGRSKTGKVAVKIAEKRHLITHLIRAGYSLTEVAEHIGQNPGNIHRHIKAILKDLRIASEEDIRHQRLLEVDRCEQIIKANWIRATSENAPGKFSSQDRIIKVMERKARLLGLDRPTKVAPVNPDGDEPYEALSEDAIRHRIATLFDSARARRDSQLSS